MSVWISGHFWLVGRIVANSGEALLLLQLASLVGGGCLLPRRYVAYDRRSMCAVHRLVHAPRGYRWTQSAGSTLQRMKNATVLQQSHLNILSAVRSVFTYDCCDELDVTGRSDRPSSRRYCSSQPFRIVTAGTKS